jgi:hypothetical protein
VASPPASGRAGIATHRGTDGAPRGLARSIGFVHTEKDEDPPTLRAGTGCHSSTPTDKPLWTDHFVQAPQVRNLVPPRSSTIGAPCRKCDLTGDAFSSTPGGEFAEDALDLSLMRQRKRR